MYLIMYVAWYLLGIALASPVQYLELVSNAFTTITMTVDTPPYLVVSNPATTISVMQGVVGTVNPATASASSTSSVDPSSSSTALLSTIISTSSTVSSSSTTSSSSTVSSSSTTTSSSTASSISVTSGLSSSSSATVVSTATDPPAVLITFPSNTTSAVVASATSLTFSAVAVISPTSNNTAVFVAYGTVISSSATTQTTLSSDPPNSTVVFSSTGNPVASQTASPPHPLNSTIVFSSTGLPSASPAPIASSPPVTSASSTVLSANVTTATNVVSNSAQSAFNVILSTNLAAVPGGIQNQAPVPSITVPLPLISSFPAAANPTASADGSHKVVPWTVPGTNVTIIATMATPNQAPQISALPYEYTIGSMQYYISGVLNSTGNAPLNASQDPFYWDIGYGCWVEFNTNPILGASGAQLLTYSVIYNALQGMKDALLTSGWWYLAFIEIRVGPQGQVVGYATVSPSLAPKGSAPITNIQDALQALEQPVGGSSSAAVAAAPAGLQGASLRLPGAPADGGSAHKRRSWRWALSF